MFLSLTLFAAAGSFHSLPPLIVADYCKDDDLSLKVETDLSSLSKLSPTAKAPLLLVNYGGTSHTIFGSHAICRFLARINSLHLVGQNEHEKLEINEWMDYCAHEMELPASVLYYSAPAGYIMEIPDDDDNMQRSTICEKARKDLCDALEVLEEHLNRRKEEVKNDGPAVLVGKSITLADIVILSTLWYSFQLQLLDDCLDGMNHVAEWFAFCTSQPEFARVLGTKQ